MLPYLLAAQRDSHHHCPSPCYPPPPLSPVLHPSEHPWLRDANEAPDTPLGVEVLSRMQSFQAMNKLKKKALKVIADQLSSAEEMQGLQEVFKSIDENRLLNTSNHPC
ncbi:unnamed protein product [Closterium sp. NIES-54]